MSAKHGAAESRCSGGDKEAAFAHDLFFAVSVFELDIEAEADNVYVGAGTPGGASVFAVGIAEGDVDAGEFFVLQDVANDAIDADVGANSEFSYSIGVFVGVGIGPKIALKGFVLA